MASRALRSVMRIIARAMAAPANWVAAASTSSAPRRWLSTFQATQTRLGVVTL